MKTYKTSYKFEKNHISYESLITGKIFSDAANEMHFFTKSKLNEGISNAISTSVCVELNGAFSEFNSELQLMQSNANEAFAVKIDNKLYPISVDINTTVVSNPFNLFTNA